MAETESEVKPPLLPAPAFLEVICKSSGKASRFAAGTEAGFAVSLINRKLDIMDPLVLHIQAVKVGEEPVNFGPNSVLVDYGKGWTLQTVTEMDYGGTVWADSVRRGAARISNPWPDSAGAQPAKSISKSKPEIVSYVMKIFVAFIMIFVLGAIFTVALENLPRIILLINSYM